MFAKADTSSQLTPNTLPALMSARELQVRDFPPVSWVVRDILPEGVTLLAGKPKLGKSWLALQLGYSVASSTEVLGRQVRSGDVLYAALEDNTRRLKGRLQKLAPGDAPWPDGLKLATEWPKLDNGGLDAFEEWVTHTPAARLVIVDTLATVRPSNGSRESQYQSDYEALRGLHSLASDTGIAILVVHHVRKMDADDPFDTVSGTTGLTGAADSTLVLTSTSDGKVLYGRGRDMPEFERALRFDPEHCRWSDLGPPSEVFSSDTRQAILAALRDGMTTPSDISNLSGVDYDLCAKTLQRMAAGGEVEKEGRGQYRLAAETLAV
jgi:RecA-family ATPase